jgi:hypothetical protein
MKKILLFIAVLLVSKTALSQDIPQYLLILQNGIQVSSTIFEFDITIKALTPTTSFQLSGIQPILTCETGISSGTLTPTLVENSSELGLYLQPEEIALVGNVLQIKPRIPPGAGHGTIIEDAGKRVTRVRITSSVPFNNVKPNIQWKNVNNPLTKVSAYIGSINTEITNAVNHITTLDDSPLPVELTSFASTVKGSSVTLNWKTSTESKNYGFDVERKADETGWLKVGFVKGNGNSNAPKEYSFYDKPCGSSKYLYRLKQIDTDGKYKYYDNIEVILLPNAFAIEQNYPNPFNPTTSIRFQLANETHVNLKVYNMLGQEVAVLVNESLKPGYKEIKFDASKLSSGTYIYRIEAGGFTEVKKMVLMK